MSVITTEAELRDLYGVPMDVAVAKEIDHLDRHCRHFISLSPFVLIATAGADGLADVSPKGDPPGFVHVLDDRTLAIPDRPGNRRLDGLRNLLEHPRIGLLFLIPGIDETLRVNGTAEIHVDPALNERLAINGRPALSATVVTVKSAFIHCGKAFMRSKLWSDAYRVPRGEVPTIGQMIRDQSGNASFTTDQAETVRHYRETLY